VQLEGQR